MPAGRQLRVAIVGGGPAGAALATLLTQDGHDVVLFDNGRRPELVVGESLIPAGIPPLRRLADTDALLPELTQVFGARIAGGYHVASVPDRPGAGVFFSRAGAAESLVISWADDVLDDADVEEIAGVVQHEMGWK